MISKYTGSSTCDNNLHTEVSIVPLHKCVRAAPTPYRYVNGRYGIWKCVYICIYWLLITAFEIWCKWYVYSSYRHQYQQTPEGVHHYIYYHAYRATDFKGRIVDNIVMKVYEQDDPTCSRLHSAYSDPKQRREYMIAQYLPEQKCTTITLTQPYQSILGNIITKDRFPSFNEG